MLSTFLLSCRLWICCRSAIPGRAIAPAKENRKGPEEVMFLERILYCASSAIVSAVATLSLTRFLQRRRKAQKQVESGLQSSLRKSRSPVKVVRPKMGVFSSTDELHSIACSEVGTCCEWMPYQSILAAAYLFVSLNVSTKHTEMHVTAP